MILTCTASRPASRPPEVPRPMSNRCVVASAISASRTAARRVKLRFERSLGEIILRDRNHPSVVVWGILNETGVADPAFRHGVQSLPLVRWLDADRMCILNSARWDSDWTIGSLRKPRQPPRRLKSSSWSGATASTRPASTSSGAATRTSTAGSGRVARTRPSTTSVSFGGRDRDVQPFQRDDRKAEERFLKLLEQGVGLVVWHHALVNCQDWPEFEKIAGPKFWLKPDERNGVRFARAAPAAAR